MAKQFAGWLAAVSPDTPVESAGRASLRGLPPRPIFEPMLRALRHRLATGETDYTPPVRLGLHIYGFLLSWGLSERQCAAVAGGFLGVLILLVGSFIWVVSTLF